MDPITALGIFGSLSSIVSLIGQALDRNVPLNKDEFSKIIAKSEAAGQELQEKVGPRDALNRISQDILDATTKRIARRQDEIVYDIGDDTLGRRELGEQVKAARADICHTLKIIKDFNGGKLPPEFETMWSDCSCA